MITAIDASAYSIPSDWSMTIVGASCLAISALWHGLGRRPNYPAWFGWIAKTGVLAAAGLCLSVAGADETNRRQLSSALCAGNVGSGPDRLSDVVACARIGTDYWGSALTAVGTGLIVAVILDQIKRLSLRDRLRTSG